MEPGVVLIVNRHNPTERIVLDSSAGGAVMNLGVETGQTVVVRLFRAVPRTDRGAN